VSGGHPIDSPVSAKPITSPIVRSTKIALITRAFENNFDFIFLKYLVNNKMLNAFG
jgi:hypothetical protein